MCTPQIRYLSVTVSPYTPPSISRDPKLHSVELNSPSLEVFKDTLPRLLADATIQTSLSVLHLKTPTIPELSFPYVMPLLQNLDTIILCLGPDNNSSNEPKDQVPQDDVIPFLLAFRSNWNFDIVLRSGRSPAVPKNVLLRITKPISIARQYVSIWAKQLVRLRLDIKCTTTNPQSFDEIAVLLSQCRRLHDLVLIVDDGALEFNGSPSETVVCVPSLEMLNLITTTTTMMNNIISRIRVRALEHLFLQFKEMTGPWSPQPGQLILPSGGGKIRAMSFGNVSSILASPDILGTMERLEELHLLNCSLPEWLFVPNYPPFLHIPRIELAHHLPFSALGYGHEIPPP